MKESKITIGGVLKKRDQLKDEITLLDFFQGVRTGEWRAVVEKARSLRSNDANYQRFKKASVPSVWLHHLPVMVFDWEEAEITIPKKHILCKARSVGGEGYFVIVPLKEKDPDKWIEVRRLLQKQHGIPSNARQIANDRPRFVSYDPDIEINWNAVPMEPEKETNVDPGFISDDVAKISEAEQLFTSAKDENGTPLGNDTALVVFSYLRASGRIFEQAVEEIEACRFKSKSMGTPKKRAKYYEKWEKQYAESWESPGEDEPTPDAVQVPQIKVSDLKIEEPKVVEDCISDADYVRMVKAAAIAPFIPLQIEYFGTTMGVGHSNIFIGASTSGKGYINRVGMNIDDMIEPIEQQLINWRLDYHIEFNDMDEAKAKKYIPNISPIWGFNGSTAALIATLSEIPTVLVYAQEFAVAMASMERDGGDIVSTLLAIIEGEYINKVLKRADSFGKTRFRLKNYQAGVLIGGTEEDVISIFSKYTTNGLANRFLFLRLRDSLKDKTELIEKPMLEKHVTPETIFKTITGAMPRIQANYDQDWVNKVKLQLSEQYQENPILLAGVRRGVRDAIKRAAALAWLDGERKTFKLSNKDIEAQIKFLHMSQNFVDSFVEYKTDRWDKSLVSNNIQTGAQIAKRMVMNIQNGVTIGKADAMKIIETLKINGGNVARTGRQLGLSRRTIYNVVERYKKAGK